jgi:hypothetical protein
MFSAHPRGDSAQKGRLTSFDVLHASVAGGDALGVHLREEKY